MLPILDSRWSLFATVAELGSLTHAANTLNSPSSVISRQIAQLETQCGGKLFRRTGRGVVLTEFGEVIYQRIRPLITETELLADEILATSGVPIGAVHIGLLPSCVPAVAARLFRAVMDKYPRVRMHVVEGSSAQLEEWLGTGRLDIALLLRELPREEVREKLLGSLALDLIGPAGDARIAAGQIPFTALEGLPLILPAEPHVLRRRLDALARERGMQLTVALEADTLLLQRELSVAGIGYAIVATMAGARGAPPGLGAARIVQPELIRHLVLGTTQHRPHTLATRCVGAEVEALFAQMDG